MLCKIYLFVALNTISLFIFGREYDIEFLTSNDAYEILVPNYDKQQIAANKVAAIKVFSYRLTSNNTFSKTLSNSYIFDKNGNIIEQTDKAYTDLKIKYVYDTLQRLIQKTYYNAKGKITEYHKWNYNSLGNINTYTDFYDWNNEENIEKYIYDAQNKLIEINEYNEKNKIIWLTTYKYDTNGKLMEKRLKNHDLSIDRIKKYDTCGHLLVTIENGREDKSYIEYDAACNEIEYSSGKKTESINNSLKKIITDYGSWKTVETYDSAGSKLVYERYNYSKNKKIESSHTIKYNDIGKTIETKDFYAGQTTGDCFGGKTVGSDSHYHFKYEYYPNGFTKLFKSFNTDKKLDFYSEYIMEYNQ